MDYKEKYEQALKIAHETYNTQPMYREWLEKIFPELKESEDERIREALIRFHKSIIDIDGIKGADIISWLEKQKEPLDKGEISDGYHTFNELYYYRMLYNAAFFNLLPKEWVHKSKKHHTGEECFGGGWFIVMAELPTGQISNHYEMKDWDLFDIPEKDVADEWDGHTPQEAAERLHNYLLEKQGEHKSQRMISAEAKEALFDYENANIQQKDFAPQEDIPRYSIGDVLCDKSCTTLNKESQSNFEITDIRNGMYICDKCSFPISQQDEYVLVAKRIEQKSTDTVEPKFKVGDLTIRFFTDEFELALGRIIAFWNQNHKDGKYDENELMSYIKVRETELVKLFTDNVCKVSLSDCSEEYRKAYYDGYNKCNRDWLKIKDISVDEYNKNAEILLGGQVEQKPADEDMKALLRTEYEKGRADVIAEIQKEWSEEDEKKRKCLIKGLEDRMGFGWAGDTFSREEYINWLKSLRPQNRWEPSDEQMDALWLYAEQNNYDGAVLTSLYNDLKKLKEG